MRERVLELDLVETTEWFRGILRKLFSIDYDRRLVVVDVPVGEEERYVIELTYAEKSTEEENLRLEKIVDTLLAAGFKKQQKRVTAEW